ncbi:DUF1893 domain-containing protein [Candidatus Bipolaricaulota sp. J31]
MEETQPEEARAELEKLSVRGLSFLVRKGQQELFSSREEGLKPLLAAIQSLGEEMEGARVIDKVVGGAAAKLLVYAGVGEVIAAVASRPAVETLRAACISIEALDIVELIRGRFGGPCPFEVLASEIEDPAVFFRELSRRLGKGSTGTNSCG